MCVCVSNLQNSKIGDLGPIWAVVPEQKINSLLNGVKQHVQFHKTSQFLYVLFANCVTYVCMCLLLQIYGGDNRSLGKQIKSTIYSVEHSLISKKSFLFTNEAMCFGLLISHTQATHYKNVKKPATRVVRDSLLINLC